MKRIHSIDYARGLVMIIMALDHTRDLLHIDASTADPTNLATTYPFLFFTRWITHFCAPAFVFLSGTSAYLSFKAQQNWKESRRFLLKRGLWLVLLEFTIVNFGIWFDVHFQLLFLQVIGAIGFGFIGLSLVCKAPPKMLGIAGLIIIFGHDLLTGIAFPTHPALNFLGSFLWRPGLFQLSPHFAFFVGYPVLPWFGILLCGFACGKFFELPAEARKKLFMRLGAGALSLFVLLRYTNLYGDPSKWSLQKNDTFTALSFINLSKYPPSLLYTLVTLGPLFLFLNITEGRKSKFLDVLSVYGKVPLFYYLIHWYVIHTTMMCLVFLQGFHWKDLTFGPFSFGRPDKGFGLSLPFVYGVWLAVVIGMYPLCKWYGNYKAAHKENKWLRYL